MDISLHAYAIVEIMKSWLDHIAASNESAIFVLKDFHPFLDDQLPVGDHPVIVRKLRDITNRSKESRKTLVILSFCGVPLVKVRGMHFPPTFG